jgi:class 3 adenylate cyclase/CHASE2 domain-containing sensor protein
VKALPFKGIPALIALSVIIIVSLLRCLQIDFFEKLELLTYDMRAREALRFPAPAATNLGFVFIDEDSLRRVRDGSLGYRFGLYWPRQVYGYLVHELQEQGAIAVGLDVLFAELRPDHAPVLLTDGSRIESDEFFAGEMRRASNVVIAVTPEIDPPALFVTNAWARGDITTERDADGTLRRVKAFRDYRQWHPALRQIEADPGYGVDLRIAQIRPTELVLPRSQGEPIKIPLDADGNMDLGDLGGENIPPGMTRKTKPFSTKRVWHMGLVLAARDLGLSLEDARIDLPHHQIILPPPPAPAPGATGSAPRAPFAAQRPRVIPVDSQGYFYVDWSLPPSHPTLTQQPIQALLSQHHERLLGHTNQLTNLWHDKVVIVGSAAAIGNDLTDRGATPIAPDTLLVSKHWNVANSILTGRFVQRAPLALELSLIALIGLLVAFIIWESRVLVGSLLVMGIAVAYVAFATFLYIHNRYWLPLCYPVLGAMLIMQLSLVIWRVVFEQADKRRVKSILSTIVSPKIARELLRAEKLSLGGARREVTVMFADVRGFTELTDSNQERVARYVRERGLSGAAAEAFYDSQAAETLATINRYLGLVADTVINHDGTLDKFIGDCVMAFWGAPTHNPQHAAACVRAAIEAQRAISRLNGECAAANQMLEAENRARLSAGLEPKPLLPILLLGTGINTGFANVGLMGSEVQTVVRQGNYTVFGREVNLASRLESASGRGRIFIGEVTHEHLRRDAPELAARCTALPDQNLKGISAAVRIFEVQWRIENDPAVAGKAQGQLAARTAAP